MAQCTVALGRCYSTQPVSVLLCSEGTYSALCVLLNVQLPLVTSAASVKTWLPLEKDPSGLEWEGMEVMQFVFTLKL